MELVEVVVLSEINSLCRACLSNKTAEEMCYIFENALDVMLVNLAAVTVCIYI